MAGSALAVVDGRLQDGVSSVGGHREKRPRRKPRHWLREGTDSGLCSQGGRRFTAQDQVVLRLFASQAATAIANARTHLNEQRARALETGAVDYIVKPFSTTELTARIRAALRRRAEPEPFVAGELVIDYDRRRVTVA